MERRRPPLAAQREADRPVRWLLQVLAGRSTTHVEPWHIAARAPGRTSLLFLLLSEVRKPLRFEAASWRADERSSALVQTPMLGAVSRRVQRRQARHPRSRVLVP